jgi:hypothetical protein
MLVLTIRLDNHCDSVVAVDEFNGIPVLAHHGGRYPSLLADDGTEVKKLIDVARYQDGWSVTGSAGWGYGGRLEAICVGCRPSLEAAAELYPAALEAIAAAPLLYAEARAMAAALAISNQPPLSRTDYEAMAAQWKFQPQPDCKLSEVGDFSFPQYALDRLPECWINQRRGFGIKREREAAEKALRTHYDASRAALKNDLRNLSPVRTEEMFVSVGFPDEWVQKNALYTVVGRGKIRRITEDDPSVEGSHLLGHEGEMGQIVTVEIRKRTSTS